MDPMTFLTRAWSGRRSEDEGMTDALVFPPLFFEDSLSSAQTRIYRNELSCELYLATYLSLFRFCTSSKFLMITQFLLTTYEFASIVLLVGGSLVLGLRHFSNPSEPNNHLHNPDPLAGQKEHAGASIDYPVAHLEVFSAGRGWRVAYHSLK